MAIKLTTFNRSFIPDVLFPTEEGTVVSNRLLPSEDQVLCSVTLASIGQKTEYLGTYTTGHRTVEREVKQFTVLQYEACVKKHVKSIKGLEEFGIKDGRTLCSHEPTKELNEIIQECFFKVNGIHEDDNPSLTPSSTISDSGEFSQGE